MLIGILFLVCGFLITGSGFYWLHHVTSNNSFLQRIVATLYTMIGCVSVWSGFSLMVPPVADEQLAVDRVGAKWAVVKLTFRPVRNCEEETFKAILIYGNNRLEVPTSVLAQGNDKDNNVSTKYTYVVFSNPVDYAPDSIYLQTTHLCPFGFSFVTDSPIIPLALLKSDAPQATPNAKS